MSDKELASARSYWKRRVIRAGRRSRHVEVEEVSLDSLQADAVENGLVDEVVSVLGEGKEANVYLGLWKKAPLALKVYRLHRTPHKKHAVIGYAPDRMGRLAATEFTILSRAYHAGIPVPTPARRVDNMFTMRFIGDNNTRASILKETILDNPEHFAQDAFNIIERLLDNCIIHGDLSEYNLLVHAGQLFVIDFPQAIDLSSRVARPSRFEEARPILQRDLNNIAHYFMSEYDIEIDPDEKYMSLVSRFENMHL